MTAKIERKLSRTCVIAIVSGLGLTLLLDGFSPLSPAAASSPEPASLVKQTSFSIEQAENLALSKFPNAWVEEIELDRDDTPLVWQIDMKMKPLTKIELEIDAKSGEILQQRVHKW